MPDDDDFGETALGQPVFDLEELAQAAGRPSPAARARERPLVGPAWAGTLTGLDPEPVSTPFLAEPPPAAPAPPPLVQAEPVEPPEDLAATSLHRRAHPIAVGPPIRDFPPERGRAPQSAASAPRSLGAPAPQSDYLLKIALAVLIGLIIVLVVGLVVGLAYELSDPEPDAALEPETRYR